MTHSRKYLPFLLAILILMSACGRQSPAAQIGKTTNVDVSSGTVVAAEDSHGGFHGDGLSLTVITFSDDSCEHSIETEPQWKPFPPGKTVQALLYGCQIGEVEYGPYLTDEEGVPLLPEVENGYYWFLDRHSESKDGAERKELLDRYSFNFTLAVYDSDTRTLYYCEFDT